MLWSSSVCSDNCYSQSWNWLEMCFLTLPSFIHPLLSPMFSNLFLTFSKHQDRADIWVQGHDIELLSQLMQSFDYGNCYFPKDIQLTIETLQNFIGKINQEDTKSSSTGKWGNLKRSTFIFLILQTFWGGPLLVFTKANTTGKWNTVKRP